MIFLHSTVQPAGHWLKLRYLTSAVCTIIIIQPITWIFPSIKALALHILTFIQLPVSAI